MNSENVRLVTTMRGVSVNENASSENVCQFMVDTDTSCMAEAASNPASPPHNDSSNDSIRNATRMLPRRKPIARKVPISAVRLATAAYMVIIAPMIAPIEKMIDNVMPRMLMKPDMTFD